MLLALLLLHFTAALANPLHKYPYVFLLDVGNEELEKVNTEQIRISKAGGSLALRYPAIGNGEDIAHVRVSGIDFGTDLKANIVDGGPGYKYVVLVLVGNPGVSFDAVITVQTVPSNQYDEVALQNIDDSSNTDYQVSQDDDSNDSAEDLSDSGESEEASQVSLTKKSAELTQGSSNVYSYAVNEALSGYGNSVHSNANYGDEDSDNVENNHNNNDDDEEKDIHLMYRDDQIQVDQIKSQLDEYTNDGDSESQEISNSDDYSVIDDQNDVSNVGHQEQVNANSYDENEAFEQSLENGGEMYPQGFRSDDSGTIYIEEPGDNDETLDLEEILSAEYDEDYYNRKLSDPNNNNFIDKNDGLAIAY